MVVVVVVVNSIAPLWVWIAAARLDLQGVRSGVLRYRLRGELTSAFSSLAGVTTKAPKPCYTYTNVQRIAHTIILWYVSTITVRSRVSLCPHRIAMSTRTY